MGEEEDYRRKEWPAALLALQKTTYCAAVCDGRRAQRCGTPNKSRRSRQAELLILEESAIFLPTVNPSASAAMIQVHQAVS